jgi:hypothetical protein
MLVDETLNNRNRLMKRNNKRLVAISAITSVLSMTFSQNVLAAEADIQPVKVDSIGIIAAATGGHIAGNMEIKISGGFTLPAGMSCDKTYITTKATDDPGRDMLSLLLKNQGTPRFVRLRITDDPAHTAFPGRCSLQIVEIK